MGKLPDKIKAALSATLHDYEIRSIETRTLDEDLAGLEYDIERDIERGTADEDSVHILTLLRGVRDLLAIGEVGGAIQVAIVLGEVLADQEAHSHLYWHRGQRAVEAGIKSAEATWGPIEQRQARIAERRSLFERERPNFNSDQEAFEAVAKQCGVSWRTIRRTVTGN